MNKKFDEIKEAVGCIVFAVIVVVCMWLYCLATPNQLSGECDWNAQRLSECDESENADECVFGEENKPVARTLVGEFADGDLVFKGAKVKDNGRKVLVTLAFARK